MNTPMSRSMRLPWSGSKPFQRLKRKIPIALVSAVAWLTSNATAPAAGDSFKLSESLSDKPSCVKQGTNTVCSVVTKGKFKISATIFSGANFNPGQLDGNTSIQISLGNLQFTGKLGDDAAYVPGATKGSG